MTSSAFTVLSSPDPAPADDPGRIWMDLTRLVPGRSMSALEISEAARAPDHPTVTTIRANLGSVLETLQDEASGEGPGQGL